MTHTRAECTEHGHGGGREGEEEGAEVRTDGPVLQTSPQFLRCVSALLYRILLEKLNVDYILGNPISVSNVLGMTMVLQFCRRMSLF